MSGMDFLLAGAGALVVFVLWYVACGIYYALRLPRNVTAAEWAAHQAECEVMALRIEETWKGHEMPEMVRFAVEDMKAAPPVKVRRPR